MERSESYFIRIKEPMQIPGVVFEVRQRAKEGNLVSALLSHDENPNIVRGAGQRVYGNLGFPEIRRPDGGQTWYHGPTKCLIQGMPNSGDSLLERLDQRAIGLKWFAFIKELVWNTFEPSIDPTNLTFSGRDIYNADQKQIMGTSSWIDFSTIVNRACWYDEQLTTQDIQMICQDPDVDKNPGQVLEGFDLVGKTFLESLRRELRTQEISAQDFISHSSKIEAERIQRNNPNIAQLRGPCISRQNNLKSAYQN